MPQKKPNILPLFVVIGTVIAIVALLQFFSGGGRIVDTRVQDTSVVENENRVAETQLDSLHMLKQDIQSLRKRKSIYGIDKAYKEILERGETLKLDNERLSMLKEFGEFCKVIAEAYNEFSKNNAEEMKNKYVKIKNSLTNMLQNKTITIEQKQLCNDYITLLNSFELTGSYSLKRIEIWNSKPDNRRRNKFFIDNYNVLVKKLRNNDQLPQS